MQLKQRIIDDIQTLSPTELRLVQSIIHVLKKAKQPAEQLDNQAYLKVREALADCEGSWTEDILHHREERDRESEREDRLWAERALEAEKSGYTGNDGVQQLMELAEQKQVCLNPSETTAK